MSHLLKYGLRTEKGQDKEDNVLHSLPFFTFYTRYRSLHLIPSPHYVIPASHYVIPAKAGIHPSFSFFLYSLTGRTQLYFHSC